MLDLATEFGMAEDKMDERVQLVTSKAWVQLVDDWRRQQPSIPNRSEAIRELVVKGLKAEGFGVKNE